MSLRPRHLPALSRFGGIFLVLLLALALLVLPPPALRAGGAEQAAALVQGAALSAPARLAAVKAPKAELEDVPPPNLAEKTPGSLCPAAFNRSVLLAPPVAAAQRRAPGQGARAPPVFSDRSA